MCQQQKLWTIKLKNRRI